MTALFSSAFSYMRDFYSEINSATLTGAIDVVVVEQADGTLLSSPFHVRFGKLGVLKAKEKMVDILINDEAVEIHMKLDDTGIAFFVEEFNESEDISISLATSPLPPIKEPIASNSANAASVVCGLVGQYESPKEEIDSECYHHQPEDDVISVSMGKTRTPRRRKKRKNVSMGKENPISDDELRSPPPSTYTSISPTLTADTLSLASLDLMSNSDIVSVSFLGSRIPRSISDNEKLDIILDSLASSTEVDTRLIRKGSAENSKAGGSDSKLCRSRSVNPDFRYFSNSKPTSPIISRSSSPIQSDTEFEFAAAARNSIVDNEENNGETWKWGELPSRSAPVSTKKRFSQDEEIESRDSLLPTENIKVHEDKAVSRKWSLFNFLGSDSKKRAPMEENGVYLEDLKDDQEMISLYVGPQPSVVEVPSPPLITNNDQKRKEDTDDDAESGNGSSLPMSPNMMIEITSPPRSDISDEEVSKCNLKHMPSIAVSLCGGLDTDAFSEVAFERDRLSYKDFTVKLQEGHSFFLNPQLVVRIGDRYYRWEDACPRIMSFALYGTDLPYEFHPESIVPKSESEVIIPKPSVLSSWFRWRTRSNDKIRPSDPIDQSRLKDPVIDQDKQSSAESIDDVILPSFELVKKERYMKTLRLASNHIKRLNLRPGSNEAEFTVTTAYQGTSRCKCHIYLWKHTDKIVVSDIDGTITKSDVLGHILPILGKDWAQSGVASLFTKIVNNGYHIVYLSSRAIGQASITKDYLSSIRQGQLSLPDGPLFLNPTSLVSAFHREVIEKKPEEFKIACLRDIGSLFPNNNPFYAGYGNRVTDVFSYRHVNIPISRIFTINSRGQITHELTQTFQTSYVTQCSIVDHVFPPISIDGSSFNNLISPCEFSSFTYWRDPIPDVSLPVVIGIVEKCNDSTPEVDHSLDNATPI